MNDLSFSSVQHYVFQISPSFYFPTLVIMMYCIIQGCIFPELKNSEINVIGIGEWVIWQFEEMFSCRRQFFILAQVACGSLCPVISCFSRRFFQMPLACLIIQHFLSYEAC